jgi:indolepyruvate ferredoxin oxidoreductase alpha subunit
MNIEAILKAIGVKKVVTVDPLDYKKSVETVKECAAIKGVKAIIFKSPCISIVKSGKICHIGDKCNNCKLCIKKLGCPALIINDGKVCIDKTLCTGCGLCTNVCNHGAIEVSNLE